MFVIRGRAVWLAGYRRHASLPIRAESPAINELARPNPINLPAARIVERIELGLRNPYDRATRRGKAQKRVEPAESWKRIGRSESTGLGEGTALDCAAICRCGERRTRL